MLILKTDIVYIRLPLAYLVFPFRFGNIHPEFPDVSACAEATDDHAVRACQEADL